ncbi:MAG: hypothetical protein A2428_10705 [Bdellovibrionales bacterium RIFOXYC1_FULL_54_43]|nr:MAG: hypothetical protein A2428_10705 [Bdellovibrionales bacterium RIFOXYC1_FULL_54_43]OFZ85361.1 MAG: hypothetical protein A2603_05480 [Bdellovibrionales bacterium RIFOXYD1_FULL_55_31]
MLNRFTQDRGNQLVLGVYIGTFTFSLIVLWSIRSEDGTGGQFVPALSVMIAGLMALASLGLLVYFIHHIIDLIRIPTILAGIRGQLDQQIRKICKNPQGKGDPKEERYIEAVQQTSSRRVGRETVVVSEFEGHIRMIDEDRLYSLFKDEKKAFVWIPRAVGEYLIPGSVLVRIWAAKEQNDHWTKQLRKIVVIDAKRSIYQDPIYGFRQLVDVALKALSPGLNDPTTAEQCLLYLKGALGLIVARELPRMSYQRDGVHYLLKKPSFNDFVGISFNQIVHAGKHDSHVMMSVLSTIDELIPLCPSSERMHALLSPVDTIITNAESPRVQEAARQIRANAVLRK